LIKLVIVVVLSVWLAWQLRYVYDSYKVRQRVAVGLELAAQAKSIVVANAAKGLTLDRGWVSSASSSGVIVTISQYTGLITVTYGADIDGGGRTLTLVPVSAGHANGYAFTGNSTFSSILYPASQIGWVCASADIMTRNTTVQENKGTLRSKYTPLECRWKS
jgi:type IV pilus assembly protein PilA